MIELIAKFIIFSHLQNIQQIWRHFDAAHSIVVLLEIFARQVDRDFPEIRVDLKKKEMKVLLRKESKSIEDLLIDGKENFEQIEQGSGGEVDGVDGLADGWDELK